MSDSKENQKNIYYKSKIKKISDEFEEIYSEIYNIDKDICHKSYIDIWRKSFLELVDCLLKTDFRIKGKSADYERFRNSYRDMMETFIDVINLIKSGWNIKKEIEKKNISVN